MTAAEVTGALHEFEQRLRHLGVPVVDRLRPGLTRTQVEEICVEFGVRLSEDAAAWWMWHDGDRLRSGDGWGTPSLTPFRVFCGLRSALEQSAQAHANTWDGDIDPERPDLDWGFHRQWVTLLQGSIPPIIDCRDPDAPDSPTGVWAADGGLCTTISLTERIRWWCWALDNGYWVLLPDGSWTLDAAHAPEPHERDHAW